LRRQSRTLRVGLALMTLIAISHPAYAGEPSPADKWTFALRPYLWPSLAWICPIFRSIPSSVAGSDSSAPGDDGPSVPFSAGRRGFFCP